MQAPTPAGYIDQRPLQDDHKLLVIGGGAMATGLIVFLATRSSQPPAPAPIVCPDGTQLQGGQCIPVTPSPQPEGVPFPALAPLNVRSGPGTGFAIRGSVPKGQTVRVKCQAQGCTVVGGDGVWDYLLSPVEGWAADYYIGTGSNGFKAGLPRCTNIPSCPPSGGPLPVVGPPPLPAGWPKVGWIVAAARAGTPGVPDYVVIADSHSAYGMAKRWIATSKAWSDCGYGSPSRIHVISQSILNLLPTRTPPIYGNVFSSAGNNFVCGPVVKGVSPGCHICAPVSG